MHNPRTVIDVRSNDPCVQDRRGECLPALPGIATAAHPIPSQIWVAGPEKADHYDCRKSGKFTLVDISQCNARKQHSGSGTCFQHFNPNRYIPSWVGSSVSKHKNWRPLEQRRATNSHKHYGTESALPGHSIISERMATERESYSSRNGQHDGCGTKSNKLTQLASDIRNLCQSKKITLIAQHLPGIHNTEADAESRHRQQDRMDTRETIVGKYPEMLPQAISFSLLPDCTTNYRCT